MAITIDNDDYTDVWGRTLVRKVKITLDNSYPAGGYAVTAAGLGFGGGAVLKDLIIMNPGVGGRQIVWDSGNQKLMAFRENDAAAYTQGAAMVELAAASAVLNGLVVHAIAIAQQGNHT